jgi:hypothetical protein
MKTINILTKEEVKEMINKKMDLLRKDFQSDLNRLLLKMNDLEKIREVENEN